MKFAVVCSLSLSFCLLALTGCPDSSETPKPDPADQAPAVDMRAAQDMTPPDMRQDMGKDLSEPVDMKDMAPPKDMEQLTDDGPDASDMTESGPQTLRFATWNILYLDAPGQGSRAPRTSEDYERLKGYVARLDADVIALQEIHGVDAVRAILPEAQWESWCEQRSSTQNVCMAVRKDAGWTVVKNPDVTELNIGGNLRTGQDTTLTRQGYKSVRILNVHMKADCYFGDTSPGCTTFFSQIGTVEAWIDARATEQVPFVVMGDFNRFLTDDDKAWLELDDSEPANADLTKTTATDNTPCWGNMFANYIDYIILDPITASWLQESQQLVFDETDFNAFSEKLSDHCPLWADLKIPTD